MAFNKIPQKLAFQFAIVMVVLTALPVILAAVILVDINRTALESATMELYSNIAKMSALEVDFFIGKKQESAEILGNSIDVALNILNPEALKAFGEYFDDDASLISAAIYDLSGERIFEVTRGDWVNPIDGVKDVPSFNNAKSYQRQSVFLQLDGLKLVVYTPIRGGFVLETVYDAYEITVIIDEHRFGRSGATCLISNEGGCLYKPEYDLLPGALSEYSNYEKMMGFIANQTFATAEGWTDDGDNVLVAYAPTSKFDGGVFVHQLYNDAYRSSIIMTRTSIIGVIGGVIFAVLIAVIFSLYMTKPLIRLTDAASRLANGDLKVKVSTRRTDELGSLINTFNEMVASLREKEALRELAIRDELTGLYNRREMGRILDMEMERYRRYQYSFSLVMIDIDHFKEVNDEYGHQAGDGVLKWLADIFTANLRSTEQMARYGGEEFVIILPQTNAGDAYRTTERMRELIENTPFKFRQDESGLISIPIKISSGIAEVPQDADTEDDLIKTADDALYEAKRTGRNRTVLYSDITQEACENSNSG
jgi:diguanylate cyclase (GGDEF)-like protein